MPIATVGSNLKDCDSRTVAIKAEEPELLGFFPAHYPAQTLSRFLQEMLYLFVFTNIFIPKPVPAFGTHVPAYMHRN
ncbi:hypothetical protein AVM02_11250 [Brucella anthropi]